MSTVALALLLLQGGHYEPAEPLAWAPSISTGRVIARRTGKPMLVLIGDPTTQSSRLGASLNHPSMHSLLSGFVPVAPDEIDSNLLAQKYSIARLPAALFLSAEGQLHSRWIGYMWSNDMREAVSIVHDAIRSEATLALKVAQKVASGAELARLAIIRAHQKRGVEAVDLAARAADRGLAQLDQCELAMALGEMYRADNQFELAAVQFRHARLSAATSRQQFKSSMRLGLALRRTDNVAEGVQILGKLNRIKGLDSEDTETAEFFALRFRVSQS